MSDYIKREDAINALYEECNKDQSLSCPYQFFDGIERIPAADVRESVHGHWIKLDMHRGMEQYKCSACGQSCYVPECMGEPMYLFCPDCGARMDGGKEK